MADNNDSYNLNDLMNESTDDEQESKSFNKKENNDEKNDKKSEAKRKRDRKRKNANADFEEATQSTREKKKKQFSIWDFFKKHIMKYLIGLIVGIILGIILFVGGSSDDENKQIYEVDDSVSLEDQIDNVKAHQLDAIRQQFSDLRSKDGLDTEEQDKIASINKTVSDSIDPFLKSVMNTPLNPSKDEVKKRENKLKDLSTGENDEKNYDKTAIENLIKGNSAAKEMNKPGVKSGATFASLMGTDKKKNNVYLTVTPFTTKEKTVNVIYLIKTNNDGKFVTGTYIGYINTSDSTRAKDLYGYLSNILKGDVNADQVNKAINNQQQEQKSSKDVKKEQKEAADKAKKESKKAKKDKKEDKKKKR